VPIREEIKDLVSDTVIELISPILLLHQEALNKIESNASNKERDIMKEVRQLAGKIDNTNTNMSQEFHPTLEWCRSIRSSHSTEDLHILIN
jgi:hypothetical protein